MKIALPLLSLLLVVPLQPASADWPQWRGPDRNGTISENVSLPESLGEENAPVKLWETDGEIPSDHYGGHGSVAVSGGHVFLSLVWHRDEPTETRRIDGDVLSKLDYRGTGSIPKEIVEKMENDRMNLSRGLRGAALEEWAKNWVDEHIDPKTKLSLGGWIISRFKKGSSAIPLGIYETLQTASKLTFANQQEMEAWVDEQDFEPAIRDQIIQAVPNTKKVADDVVLCLDATTGKETWRFETPGFPSGRSSSSTPTIHEGRVFAALSEHLYCLDAKSGEEIWRSPLTGRRGPASSPLVTNGKVVIQQNMLTAFDEKTGEEIWNNPEVKGSNSSPAIWRNTVICNSQRELVGVDLESGELLWGLPGGGDGTPVVSGDHLVIISTYEGKNLIAYQLGEEGPEEMWSHDFLAHRYSSSPIIFENSVYHLGSNRHLCLDLATGEVKWEVEAQSSISSPIVADGKLLVYENRGGLVSLIRANPSEYEALGRAKVGALYCASPAIVGKDLYLRTAKTVAAYRFE